METLPPKTNVYLGYDKPIKRVNMFIQYPDGHELTLAFLDAGRVIDLADEDLSDSRHTVTIKNKIISVLLKNITKKYGIYLMMQLFYLKN